MALINVSYQVLSDPVQRAAHDRWIAQQEQSAVQPPAPSSPWPRQAPQSPPHATPQPPPAPSPTIVGSTKRLVSHVFNYWFLYGIAAVAVWGSLNPTPTKPPPAGPKPYQASRVPEVAAYVRPTVAPNGQPWPGAAGYVKGYQQLHSNGLSTVTVDNSRNDSDVFVKLVSLDSAQAYPVRQFYIPASGSFTLKKVNAGSYDVRYRDLGSGGLSRSEVVTLSEMHTAEGARFSNLTMTLYKVKNGNMKTFGLAEAEF